jgi:DNA (cytosine-5)-methyltransferase 1
MKKPTVIDLFSGAGGLSLGFLMSGFQVAGANEIEESYARTFKRNHPETFVLTEDIRNLSAKDLLDRMGVNKKNIDIVIGGPPCQGFSLANAQTRFLNNPNNRLFRDFIRIVEGVKPSWFVMENVPGLIRMNEGKVKDEIINAFEKLGYKVKAQVLNAADFGVPQTRRRIVFVGNRVGVDFEFPKPTHIKTNKWEYVSVKNHYTTVDEAFSDLPLLGSSEGDFEMEYAGKPKSDYQKVIRNGTKKVYNHIITRSKPEVLERYKHIPQGGNWANMPLRLMKKWRSIPFEEIKNVSHSSLYKRLHPDEPSITIANFRKSMIIHPYEDRGLSIREAARLQSFPDDFIFEGSKGQQQQQIANAVPPLLGKALADAIIRYF